MRQRIEFVAMRDGAKLFTNIWMPDEPGRYPVILVRSPYDDPKNYGGGGTREGYVTIYQSCRGTAGSQGEIIAYVNERRDGLDTLSWIRRQDFYNGEIYVIGGSYLSTVHLMYLDTCPSDVRGGLLKIQDCDRYNIHYENGQYKVGLHYGWAVGNMIKRHPELAGRYDKEKAIRELPAKDFAKRLLGDRTWFHVRLPGTSVLPGRRGPRQPGCTGDPPRRTRLDRRDAAGRPGLPGRLRAGARRRSRGHRDRAADGAVAPSRQNPRNPM